MTDISAPGHDTSQTRGAQIQAQMHSECACKRTRPYRHLAVVCQQAPNVPEASNGITGRDYSKRTRSSPLPLHFSLPNAAAQTQTEVTCRLASSVCLVVYKASTPHTLLFSSYLPSRDGPVQDGVSSGLFTCIVHRGVDWAINSPHGVFGGTIFAGRIFRYFYLFHWVFWYSSSCLRKMGLCSFGVTA